MAQRIATVTRSAEPGRLDHLLALHEVALDTMAHGLCMYDAGLRVVLFNRAFLEHYGLTSDALRVGMSMQDVFRLGAERLGLTPDQLEIVWDRRLERLAAGEPFSGTYRLPDGRVLGLHLRPMQDGGWVSVHEDITRQDRMEQELRRQFERMQQAISSMSFGLCMFDPEERLIVCNKRYLEIYDFDPDVVRPGISHREILDHWLSRGNQPGATVEGVYAERMRLARSPSRAAMQMVRKDGRVIEATSHPTPDGGWVTAHEDVTERLNQGAALREQNLRFDAALNNMSHGLAMYDADQNLIVCNSRFLEIFRADPAVVKPGVSLRDIFAHGLANKVFGGGNADEMVERRRQLLAGQRPLDYHMTLLDGRTVSIAIRPMPSGGYVGTYEDITERRRLELERAAALKDLREQNERFDATVNNMSQGLCMFDAEQRLIVCNEKYLTIFRADPAVVKPGATQREIFEYGVSIGLYQGLTADDLMARRMTALAQQRPISYDQTMVDGRTVAITISPMPNGGWVGTFEDVSEARRIEGERIAMLQQLREQHDRFNVALDNMSHGLLMIDDDMRVIVSNQRYLELFRLSPDAAKPGMRVHEVMEHAIGAGNFPGDTADQRYRLLLEKLKSNQMTATRHLGDGRIMQITHRPMAQGGWVAIYEDITERHKAQERISHMARHDALTGLPNRVLFRERMAEGLARVEAGEEAMAVLCLDLDQFKAVNDTLGHPVGDRLLSAVAERLVCVIGHDDCIARLGGDEFAILQSGSQPGAATALARRIVEVLAQPIIIDDHEINSGASIGIAVAPTDGTAADHLIKCADLALYRAKADGRSRFRFFETDMDTRLREKRALEIDLRKAFAAGEFELAYQPQIRSSDGELTGMEALLRWNHAARGNVPPAEFIPLAEETGLIVPLGEWVLRRACAEAASWPRPIRIAVNLSPAQFKSRGLVATVTGALAAAGLAPTRLELEITEAALLQDDDLTLAMLHQLRALGVRISMDDFGTGYSSLSYLRSFPFDKIKIDRSFIADLDRGRDSAAIIRAVAGLGASLGIETTAEGVETVEQFERVRRDGCTEIQGYFFSPPLPAAEVFALVARWRRERAVA